RLASPPIVDRAPQSVAPAPEPGRGPAGENVIAMSGNGASRSTAPRLTKPGLPEATLNGARGSVTGAVVSRINRQAAAGAPALARPVIEPVVLRQPEPVVLPDVVIEPKVAEPVVVKSIVAEPKIVASKPLVVEPSVVEPVAIVELSVAEPVAIKP